AIDDQSEISDQVTSYSWDFEGNDVIDSTHNSGDNGFGTMGVEYSVFGGSGSYTMKVSGTNLAGCSNEDELTVELYASPTTPESVTVSTDKWCTNDALVFSYDSLDSLSPGSILQWFIAEEDTLRQDSVEYTFTTTGEKVIGLQVLLAGCSTAIYQDTLELSAGPQVGFSYSNNCYGDSIVFANESDVGVQYVWDYGDGSDPDSSVVSTDPKHLYSYPDTVTVSLQVENALGCMTQHSEELIMADSVLAIIDVSELIENVSTQFVGVDSTQSDDSVTYWLWNFDSLSSHQEQSPEFSFSETGEVEVYLIVNTQQGCSDTLISSYQVNAAIFPTAAIELE
ncbi:MAG: hypothetical protein JXQ90_24155, partial [Cyclobacteriaceae bacterium]